VLATSTATIREFDQRVVVQSKTASTDTQLGRSVSWGTFATIWAKVRVTGSSETKENERVTTLTTYEVETIYRSDITTAMRLSWTPFRGSAKELKVVGQRINPARPGCMFLDCQEAA
jgi:SPP1 family predicted phage head-tail adaptor